MALVNIKIENKSYQVDSSLTVLEAAKQCGYNIPTLCSWNKGKCSLASCRVCLVKIKQERNLVPACVFPVREGLEIFISDPAAVAARRTSVELLLSNHSFNCQSCPKSGACELLEVSNIVGANPDRFMGEKTPVTVDDLADGIIRDTSKCILCTFP